MGADVVDTSDQDEVILAIPTGAIRAAGAISDELRRVLADLILGRPVAGYRLDRWGITALGLLTEEEVAARAMQGDLFRTVH